MKKFIITLTVVLYSLPAITQNQKDITSNTNGRGSVSIEKPSKWVIGLYASADLIKQSNLWYHYELPDNSMVIYNHNTSGLSCSAGIKITKIFANKLCIKTGIAISYSEYVSAGGYSNSDSAKFISISYNYDPMYVNCPFMFGYRFTNNKINIYPYIGIGGRKFIGQNDNSAIYSSYYKSLSFNDISKTYFDLLLNIEVDYAIAKHTRLSFEPSAKRSMMNSDTFYLNFNIALGVNYTF